MPGHGLAEPQLFLSFVCLQLHYKTLMTSGVKTSTGMSGSAAWCLVRRDSAPTLPAVLPYPRVLQLIASRSSAQPVIAAGF